MRKLLIVVDYQNDFVKGALGFEKAIALEDRICNKIEEYKNDSSDIVCTFDTHDSNYSNTQEGRKLPISHCIKNTDGWELFGKINNLLSENIYFEKNTFGSVELAEFLKGNEFDTIELVGVVTNMCVISNAVIAKTFLPEAEIIIDAQCVASNDDNLNEKALDVMESLQMTIINRL